MHRLVSLRPLANELGGGLADSLTPGTLSVMGASYQQKCGIWCATVKNRQGSVIIRAKFAELSELVLIMQMISQGIRNDPKVGQSSDICGRKCALT